MRTVCALGLEIDGITQSGDNGDLIEFKAAEDVMARPSNKMPSAVPLAKNPTFFERVNLWCKEYGGLVSLIATLAAFLSTALLFLWRVPDSIDNRIEKVAAPLMAEQTTKSLDAAGLPQMKTDLHEIQGRVDEMDKLLHDISQRDLQKSVSMSGPVFNKNLRKVGNALTIAKVLRSPVDTSTVEKVREKLLATPSTTDSYWGAAAALVSLRSNGPRVKYPGRRGAIYGDVTSGEQISRANSLADDAPLPDCSTITTVRELLSPLQSGVAPQFANLSAPQLRSCRLDLKVTGLSTHPSWAGTPTLECAGCDIVYSGGTIPILEAGTTKLIFLDCRFNVDAGSSTPAPGKELVHMLLAASDESHAELEKTGS